MQELLFCWIKFSILRDLTRIGISCDFDLKIKAFSKTNYGTYNPNNNTITIWVYKDKESKTLYPYSELLETAIHECVHCIQWSDPEFKRVKGVMHNSEFWGKYNKYCDRAKALLLLDEVRNNEELENIKAKNFLAVS